MLKLTFFASLWASEQGHSSVNICTACLKAVSLGQQ